MQFVDKLCYELRMLITDYELQPRENFVVYLMDHQGNLGINTLQRKSFFRYQIS